MDIAQRFGVRRGMAAREAKIQPRVSLAIDSHAATGSAHSARLLRMRFFHDMDGNVLTVNATAVADFFSNLSRGQTPQVSTSVPGRSAIRRP